MQHSCAVLSEKWPHSATGVHGVLLYPCETCGSTSHRENTVGMQWEWVEPPQSQHTFSFTSLTSCTGPFDSLLLRATSRCLPWQQVVYLIKKPHVWGPSGPNPSSSTLVQQWKSWTLSKLSCQHGAAGTKSIARSEEELHPQKEERWWTT